MLNLIRNAVFRRSLAGTLMLGTALMACSAQAATYTMYRDPNCGCCSAWAAHFEAAGNDTVNTVDHSDIAAVKAENGVPKALRSCHTMLVEGYVIEGHVPAADIARLLREKPEGVTGLAVPGMPMGSPGMEHGDQRQAYQVIAFGPSGQTVWVQYAAKH